MTPSSFYLSWQNLLFLHFSGRFIRVLDLLFIAIARLVFHPWIVRNAFWSLVYFNGVVIVRAWFQLFLLVLNPLAKLALTLVRRFVHKKVAYFPSFAFSFPSLIQLYLPVTVFSATQAVILKIQFVFTAVLFIMGFLLFACVLF